MSVVHTSFKIYNLKTNDTYRLYVQNYTYILKVTLSFLILSHENVMYENVTFPRRNDIRNVIY